MKKAVYLFVFIFLVACSEEESVEIPSTILPKEKMAAVLVDIHLIEATMNLNVMSIENAGAPANAAVSIDVLKKHNITKSQYDTSFLFYTQHPDMLSKIYENVIIELSKLQARVSNDNNFTDTSVNTTTRPIKVFTAGKDGKFDMEHPDTILSGK